MPREKFRNNLKLVLLTTGGVLAVFVALEVLLRKSRDFSPDFLASVLLYGLTVLNLTLILVLVFVLGRNLVRVLLERRRGVLGARLRMPLAPLSPLMSAPPLAPPDRRGKRPHPADRRPLVQRGRRAHALLVAGPGDRAARERGGHRAHPRARPRPRARGPRGPGRRRPGAPAPARRGARPRARPRHGQRLREAGGAPRRDGPAASARRRGSRLGGRARPGRPRRAGGARHCVLRG